MLFRVHRPGTPEKGLAVGYITLCSKHPVHNSFVRPALIQAGLLSENTLLESRYLGIHKRASITDKTKIYYQISNMFNKQLMFELWEMKSIPLDPPKTLSYFPFGISTSSSTTTYGGDLYGNITWNVNVR